MNNWELPIYTVPHALRFLLPSQCLHFAQINEGKFGKNTITFLLSPALRSVQEVTLNCKSIEFPL